MTSVPHEKKRYSQRIIRQFTSDWSDSWFCAGGVFFNNFGRNVTNISLFAGALFSFMSLAVSYFRFKSASHDVGFFKEGNIKLSIK